MVEGEKKRWTQYLWISRSMCHLIDSVTLPSILLQFNYILGECKSSQGNELALYTIPDI